MTELLVQNIEPSPDLCDRLTAKVLELVSEREPVPWSVVLHNIAGDAEPHGRQAVHSAIWHAVKNGLVTADDNSFLRLASKSSETIETTANY